MRRIKFSLGVILLCKTSWFYNIITEMLHGITALIHSGFLFIVDRENKEFRPLSHILHYSSLTMTDWYQQKQNKYHSL